MALTLRLGHGFTQQQTYLTGTDGTKLPAFDAGNVTSPTSLTSEYLNPTAGDYTAVGAGGASFTTKVAAIPGGLSFTMNDDWNLLKNIQVTEPSASKNLYIDNFVHADVLLGTSYDKCGAIGSTVTLHDAKRGNVVTGNGGDTVNIDMASNDVFRAPGARAVNEFRIATNGGNDTINLRAGGFTDFSDPSRPEIKAKSDTGKFSTEKMINDGSLTATFVDAGAGNDKVISAAGTLSDDSVWGGSGNDYISTAGGTDVIEGGTDCGLFAVFNWKICGKSGTTKVFLAGDTLEGGAGEDTFVYRKGDGVDQIKDFVKGTDHLQLDASLQANTVVEKIGSDSFIYFKNGGNFESNAAIRLLGVTDFAASDITFA